MKKKVNNTGQFNEHLEKAYWRIKRFNNIKSGKKKNARKAVNSKWVHIKMLLSAIKYHSTRERKKC